MTQDRPPSSIRVVCCDMSQNALGRAQVLAEVGQQIAPTQIIGVQRRNTIWAPALNSSIAMKTFRFRGPLDLGRAATWLAHELQGHQVVISKPRVTSLDLARRAGVDFRSAVLDIDDWELGCMLPGGGRGQELPPDYQPTLTTKLRGLDKGINSPLLLHAMETLAFKVPTRLVSNSWLKARFGGELLPHLRDTSKLSPNQELRQEMRARLQLGDRIWVSFIGTARSHKGLGDLIVAVQQCPDQVGLLLCGLDRNDRDGRQAAELAEACLGEQRVRIVPPFKQQELQGLLSASDIAAVPSQASAAAMGQIPAKLFDALSMGLPLVATSAGSIPEVVADAGRVVRPGDMDALSQAISELAMNEELRRDIAVRARSRAVEHYDVRAGVPILSAALQKAQSRRPEDIRSSVEGGSS